MSLLFWTTKSRLRRIDRKIAGLDAKARVTQEILDLLYANVPTDKIVCDLQNIAAETAELETLAMQLRRKP